LKYGQVMSQRDILCLHSSVAAQPGQEGEFGIINKVEHGRGYQAKVYKFNNRKDDAVFSKDTLLRPSTSS